MSISFSVGPHRIRFAGKTDIGKVRKQNEDSILVPSEMALGVVSDGMGGHACGDVASKITVETIDSHYRKTAASVASPATFPLRLPPLDVERSRMETAIRLANARIFEEASADKGKKGMGCTVDAIYFSQGRIFVGHVGDSRVYRIREGRIQMVTEDHSLFNDWMRMKGLTPDDEVSFPLKNVVVRALGLHDQVQVDVITEEYRVGDTYLLCSDGLNGMIKDSLMLELVLKYTRLDSCCSKLIDAANDAGGNDNISALLVRVEKV